MAQRRHLPAVRAQLRRRERGRDRRSRRRARAPALPGRARHRRDLVQPVVPVADVGRGLRHLRLPGHRPGLRHAGGRGRAHRRGARARHPDHHRRRAEPRLGSAPLVPGRARRRAGIGGAGPILVPAGPRPGRRPAAERLAVDLRRAGLDPGHGAGLLPGTVVPAPVRARAAGFQLGEPRGSRRVRGRAAVLVRSRRGRHPDRLRGAAQQGRVAARGGAGRNCPARRIPTSTATTYTRSTGPGARWPTTTRAGCSSARSGSRTRPGWPGT